MSKPHYPTINFESTHFLESAGCVQFVLPTPPHIQSQVIVVHCSSRQAYLLAKGRRNINESRAKAALRETEEETGLKCRMMPIRLKSRAPPAIEEGGYTEDVVRTFDRVTEPFMLMTRHIGAAELKLIWWYIAIVEEVQPEGLKSEEGLTPVAMNFDEAVEALEYDCDKKVLQAAIKLFEESHLRPSQLSGASSSWQE